jgi:hypothetical protein
MVFFPGICHSYAKVTNVPSICWMNASIYLFIYFIVLGEGMLPFENFFYPSR